MKSAFYSEWNKHGLGTIDDKTTWLLSIVAKLLIWWDTYKTCLYMPAWFSWDLSEYKDKPVMLLFFNKENKTLSCTM